MARKNSEFTAYEFEGIAILVEMELICHLCWIPFSPATGYACGVQEVVLTPVGVVVYQIIQIFINRLCFVIIRTKQMKCTEIDITKTYLKHSVTKISTV